MRAIQVRELGDPRTLRVVDIDAPEPGRGEVALAVHAAGVNFPDALMVLGRYQVKPPLPFVLGVEAAGVVTAVGEGVVDVRPGDRVAAPVGGAFAERVVARASATIALPEHVDFVTAAGMVLTYGTAYHALVDRARIRSGDRLVVTGAGGGVGTAACDIGRALGAEVTALVGSAAKGEAAREAGAARVVAAAGGDVTARLKAEIGAADVLLDNVGGEVFDAALRAMEWNGRVLIVGFAGGRIPEIPANRLLLKELDAIGVYWGAWAEREPARNRANFDAMFALMAQGALHPRVRETYALDDAPKAVTAMLERRLVGKAVVLVRG